MRNLMVAYDSETTGLPLWKLPSEHPDQPHIVQLAACLFDVDTRKVLSTLDVMVRPDGWLIPDEVSAIHGITTEMAADLGVPESLAVEMLLDLVGDRTRIGHNEPFDARMVRIACMRHFEPSQADAWKEGDAECTQKMATPILRIPPTDRMKAAGFTKFKTANLREAVLHFTGKPLENAHSALADVHGCMSVWFAIKDLQAQERAAA
jgi:DNA polymerase III subunit epsilon